MVKYSYKNMASYESSSLTFTKTFRMAKGTIVEPEGIKNSATN